MIVIELECDGWTIINGEDKYHWNHNDELMGTEQIKEFLEDIGYDVEVEEVY